MLSCSQIKTRLSEMQPHYALGSACLRIWLDTDIQSLRILMTESVSKVGRRK